MSSYFQRYVSGELGVWDELRALDPVPAHLLQDVEAVAAETMRRVRRHVVRIAETLGTLGIVDMGCQVPSADDVALLDKLAGEIGGLPAAFDACLRYVGDVDFMGDSPELELYYDTVRPASGMPPGVDYPDPLSLPNADYLQYEWESYTEDKEDDDELFVFPFAPDELHKANISGSTHDIVLPATCVDPPLDGVAGRPGITLVEYLRVSIAWGGFPGWEFAPEQTPAAVTALRVQPDF